MILDILGSSLSIRNKIGLILLMVPGLLIALMVHEIAHGFIAWKLGDPTAKNLGRLSLNPVRHLDPVGTVMLFLIGFGWAKPVPVNSRNFKKPRRDIALTSLAGPVSNFLLALCGGLVWGALARFSPALEAEEITVWLVLLYGTQYFISINIGLGLFNLIPIPPLDGSNILACLLPPTVAAKYLGIRKYTQYIYLGLILLSILSNRIELFSIIQMYLWYPLTWCRSMAATGIYRLVYLLFGI